MALTPGALATAEGRCMAWAAGSWPQEGSMGRPGAGPCALRRARLGMHVVGAIQEHDQQEPGTQPPCRHSDGPRHREQEQVSMTTEEQRPWSCKPPSPPQAGKHRWSLRSREGHRGSASSLHLETVSTQLRLTKPSVICRLEPINLIFFHSVFFNSFIEA